MFPCERCDEPQADQCIQAGYGDAYCICLCHRIIALEAQIAALDQRIDARIADAILKLDISFNPQRLE